MILLLIWGAISLMFIPTNVAQGFQFPHIFTITCYFLLNIGHPRGCESVAHCDFDWHFSDDQWHSTCFHTFVGHLCILSVQLSFFLVVLLCFVLVFGVCLCWDRTHGLGPARQIYFHWDPPPALNAHFLIRLSNILLLFCWVVEVLQIFWDVNLLVRNMIWKYFLPFHKSSLHFVECSFDASFYATSTHHFHNQGILCLFFSHCPHISKEVCLPNIYQVLILFQRVKMILHISSY